MWVVRAGKEAAHYQRFADDGYVAIGGDEVANVSPTTAPTDLEALMSTALPSEKPGTVKSWAAQYHRFATELNIGDDVLTYNLEDQTFLLGTIVSEPELHSDWPLPWVRRARWTHRVRREVLSESTRQTLGAIQSLFKINERSAQELRSKAETITSAEDRARMTQEFWRLCGQMLDEYPRRPPTLSASSPPVQIRRQLQATLDTVAKVLVSNPNWRAAASVGQGNWVTDPWCAVYDTRETVSAQKGTYPVLHFRSRNPPYLKLGWGVSWTQFGAENQRRALEVAQMLTPDEVSALAGRGFYLATRPDTPTVPEDGQLGTVLAKFVARPVLDADTSELTEDFRVVLSVYKSWVERTSTPVPASEPTSIDTTPIIQRKTYSLDWLAAETQLNVEFLQELVDALTTRTPQIILAGPPGTSKTWLARKLSEYLTQGSSEDQTIVQFHPSYSYEEFVEGLRPTAVEGAIRFDPVDGHLLRVVERMENRPSRHVMILDEINRANLPRVLGELLYLLEYRDQPLNLQFSSGFKLPGRLLFIGTMNTADRSIRSLDAALRRRFEVFECMPDADLLAAYYESRPNAVADLVQGFSALNDALTRRRDRHHTIGHAFFMAEEMTPQRLLKMWKYKVGPLIEEYFFDQPDVLAEFTPPRFWTSLADLA